MSSILGPNWKTALSGILTALFGFILFSPQYFPPWMLDLAKYAMVGGLISLGITAKDYSTHSTATQVNQATADAQAKLMGNPPPAKPA